MHVDIFEQNSYNDYITVTTTSVDLSSNKIQNGDILVLANPGPPGHGQWLLKWRERE